MIEKLFAHYLTVTDDAQAAATLVLAEVMASSQGSTGDYLSLAGAAKMLGVSPDTVGRLCNSGKLKHKRIGRLIRINRPDLDEYMEEVERETTPPLRCLRA